MLSTRNIPFETLLVSPTDQHEGAALSFDPDAKEIILRAWCEDHELAFLRLSADDLLAKLGINRLIEARIKQGIAEGLLSRSATIEVQVRQLKIEAAGLLCPFEVGDMIEALSPKKGRYIVHGIHDRHHSWAMTCFKVDVKGDKMEFHATEFNDTAKVRLVESKRTSAPVDEATSSGLARNDAEQPVVSNINKAKQNSEAA